MLLSQRQNFLSIRSLAKKCVIASLAVHVIVLFALLFIYKDYHQRLIVDLGKHIPSAAVVKILPLSAKRPAHQQLGVKGGKGSGAFIAAKTSGIQKTVKASGFAKASPDRSKGSQKAAAVKNQKKNLHKTVIAQSVKKKIVSKKQLAKQNKKKAQQEQKKKTEEKKVAKAMADKKVNLLKQAKPEPAKKQEVLKPETIKPEQVKKEIAKQEVLKPAEKQSAPVQEPIITKNSEAVVAVEAQPIATQSTITSTQAVEGTQGQQPEGQEFLYVTQQEFDVMQLQQKLQTCVFDRWTPPLGVPESAVCEVVVTVGWDGSLIETQYLTKTLILTYDLSVQEALDQVQFPHEVWGKRITITFKP